MLDILHMWFQLECCASQFSISFGVVPVMPCPAAMFLTCKGCVAMYVMYTTWFPCGGGLASC